MSGFVPVYLNDRDVYFSSPTRANNVTHYALTEAQYAANTEAGGATSVVAALDSITVEIRTGKTRLDEAYESGMVDVQLLTAAGY